MVPVRAADGAEAQLAITRPASATFGVLWLPALGVPARHYLPWAESLADHGIASALHEWRGAGSSSLRASRRQDWGYRELLEFDIPASLAAAREAHSGLRWIVAGHSIGGQFASMFAAINPHAIDGVAFVASGSPYWRTFPPRQRYLLRLLPPAVRSIVALAGYYPGRRIGFAGSEARTLMREWAASSRGRYANYIEGVDTEADMASFHGPLLCVHLSEDRLCPQASAEWLLAKFPRAAISRIRLEPADFPAGAAGHFSWLKEPGPVARRLRHWAEHSLGAAGAQEGARRARPRSLRSTPALEHCMTLFDSLPMRDVRLRNRIAVSPMCEYSAVDGVPNAWHMVHLGSRAVGGAGLVFTEATAVEARGRISPADTGIWNEAQAAAWAPIAEFLEAQGAVPGIQLAHAGRKASTPPPWAEGHRVEPEDGGWTTVAPSALAYAPDYPHPLPLDAAGIGAIVDAFRSATRRAIECGFRVIEIHAAHGYLLHQFLSPLSNRRSDQWGGSFENRIRLTRSVVAAARAVMPERLPLVVRISATDWIDGGWDLEQSIELSRLLKDDGVDMIDVSSGGLAPEQQIRPGPGYQVPFAARIRREAGVATGAVGLITEPRQAESIIAAGDADLVLLARELLRDPYWPRRAAMELDVRIDVPRQYARAW